LAPASHDRGRSFWWPFWQSVIAIEQDVADVIASQLPDKTAEALLVLDHARHMVVEFFDSSGVSDKVQNVSSTIESRH